MNPNNGSQSGGTPNPRTPQEDRSAAANVIRSQIDALYGDRPVAASPREQTRPQQQSQQQSQPQQQAQQTDNPYVRTHQAHPQPQAEQWKAYHTAWQNYYQQYYEAYYAHQTAQQAKQAEQLAQQIQQQPQQLSATPGQQAASTTREQREEYFSQRTDLEETTEDLSKDQALFELRQKLLGKVRTQATKIRGSKHFVPIAAALGIVLVFVFLQYNQVLIATVNAYVSPGSIDPQNIVIDPSSEITVGPDPRLIIPKINVDVPAVYGVGNDYDSQMAAMEHGVAHFAIPGASSHPGEAGNTVLSGHSSNDLFDGGDYKFIFAQLEKLTVGDTVYANYESKRYTYIITKTEVVKPTQVSKLVYPTTKPILTLITCTPLGTSLNRLLVTAEQVSPDPAAAAAAPSGSGTTPDETSLPGQNSPTILERLFGAR